MNKDQDKIKSSKGQSGGMPFGRRGNMMARGPVEKAKDFKGTIKKLASYLRPFWSKMSLVLIFVIASTIFSIVSPKILGQVTNQIVSDYTDIQTYDKVISKLPAEIELPAGIKGTDLITKLPQQLLNEIPAETFAKIESLDLSKRPSFHFESIRNIILLLIGLYLLSAAFGYIQGWIMTGITQKVTYQFRKDLSEKINRLPLSYFDKHRYGEVLSRVTNDVDTVSQTLNQSLSQIVTSAVMIIGIIVMMLSISPLLTLVTVIILPLSFLLITQIMKRSQIQFVNQQASLGLMNGHVEEMYSGHLVVKVFNGEKDSIKKFDKINSKLYQSAWKSQFLSGLMHPLMTFIGNLGYVGVSVVGGWLAINGKLQIGDIQAFIQYVQQFNRPITQTANIANVLQSTAAAAERVFEFLAEEEESKETNKSIVLSKVKGKIEFKNVVFGYNPDQKVIKNLSIKIEPGHRVAIVGPTGAGKTTLVNLLMRFYEVGSGLIKIDGVDIKEMKRSEVRKLFGMVLQDTWLFKGTIRDNITYGNPEASEKDLITAAQEAHVDHFVKSLPNGYDMEINEEAGNISQGEKQLLTIARAMLAKRPMLILDEATSSVDTRTEVLIQKAMDMLMKDKTSFVIAHRLSTIRDADLILVMKNGDVIEHGTHEKLLSLNGFYTELYNSQFAEA
ncbi:MAG: ABC transporter ATP-binding protein [Candidatus Shapirobacteria bacterium]